MVRRVFFSFHYERDAWRAAQVRNSWVTKENREAAGFEDGAEWEEVKKEGEEAIKEWIDSQIHGTSVTAILVGRETSEREFVQYEIKESIKQGNGIVAIRIHERKDREGNRDRRGSNPLAEHYVEREDRDIRLDQIFETYHWDRDNGRENLSEWVEEAAQRSSELTASDQKSVFRKAGKTAGEILGGVLVLAIIIWLWLQDQDIEDSNIDKQDGGRNSPFDEQFDSFSESWDFDPEDPF